MTRGPLAARLLIAGALLLLGLPMLTILVYVWGYPSTPVPRPVVLLVDGLQVAVVLYAAVVVVQLVSGTGFRVFRADGPRGGAGRRGEPAIRRARPVGLRELSFSLVEMIWERERQGGAALGEAIVEYVCDAVLAELDHRRRVDALDRRRAELEALLVQRPAEGTDQRGRSAWSLPLRGRQTGGRTQ